MKEALKYLWDRRTTVLGYIVTVLGVLATSDLFSGQTIKWFVLFIGVITAILGHHNNAVLKRSSESTPPTQGGYARVLLLILISAATIPAVILPGCQVTNPVRIAETPEQKAYALYGMYVVAQGKAAALYKDESVPEGVRKILKEGNDRSYPAAEKLIEATVLIADIREILNQCSAEPIPNEECVVTNRKRLENAVLNLSSIYYTVQPTLLGFVSTVKESDR